MLSHGRDKNILLSGIRHREEKREMILMGVQLSARNRKKVWRSVDQSGGN